MTDYGHDLWFGANLIPSNQDPDDVIGLSELADRFGLDLLTFRTTRTSPGSSTPGRC
ncbi:MAG: hypothetical protein ACRDPQ_13065 [Nocardioidaceae bacterium]